VIEGRQGEQMTDVEAPASVEEEVNE